jgi:carbonic anhydrase/acetyltransferase-like protein (isoleucine patch superfamily)
MQNLKPGEIRMSKLEQQFETFLHKQPTLGKGVYIAKGAAVLGDVTLGDHASVWYNAVLRGDINKIVIGHHTNVQDNAVLHLADDFACVLGDFVTVGHSAIVHACTVGNEVLIGMGATILDGSVIGEQSLIGAGSLVTPGTTIPAGSMVLGSPARVVRQLAPEERTRLKYWAEKYAAYAAYCLEKQINVSGPLPT